MNMNVKTYSKSKQGSTHLSANFKVSEFACHDGSDTVKIDVDLVAKLQQIRDHFGKPITVTSGYRTESYNRKIGGASKSYHTLGRAFDIVVSGVNVTEVAKFAESIGLLGIGCYKDDSFVHIDSRTSRFFWYNQSETPTSTFGGKQELIPGYGDDPAAFIYRLTAASSESDKIKALQIAFTLDGSRLDVDGLIGPKTEAAMRTHVLRNGSRGHCVVFVQRLLIPDGVDAVYGPKTAAAVKAWQSQEGKSADGVVGIKTYRGLCLDNE